MLIYEVLEKIPLDLKAEFRNLPDYVIKFLLNRGIKSYDDFLQNYSQEKLEPPRKVADIETAAKKLISYIKANKYIVIYGDYDADGIISAYILYDFLRNELNYNKVSVWLPNRFREGYGLNRVSLNKIAHFADVVVTVDCGIRDAELIKAFSGKLDFIIIDHHELPEQLPNVPIVHPMHPNGSNRNKVTSAGITVFKFVSFLAQNYASSSLLKKLNFVQDHLDKYLDIAPITIATDVMPVISENRVLVKLALQKARSSPSKTLNKIITLLGLEKEYISFKHFGFVIGPRLNATGRLYDPNLGLNFLINTNKIKFELLDKINNERKSLVDSNANTYEFFTLVQDSFIVVFDSNISEGIIGLVASHLVKNFGLPAIVITKTEDGKLKGSARSTGNVHITEVFSKISNVFEKYGGHSAAAGFTLQDSLETFIKALSNIRLPNAKTKALLADDLLDIKEINIDFANYLKMLEPFGPSNEPFVLLTRGIVNNISFTQKGNVAILLEDVREPLAQINMYMSKSLFTNKLKNRALYGQPIYFRVRPFGDNTVNLWAEDIVDSVLFKKFLQ